MMIVIMRLMMMILHPNPSHDLNKKKQANDMRTSTYRSASGFFSLGDIDIGAEEASRERDIEVDNGDNGDDDDDDE